MAKALEHRAPAQGECPMAASAREREDLARQKPFNVQPCLRDPVFHLLKDRLRLSPVAAGEGY